MVQGLALEASYDGGVGWFGSVGDDDGVVAGSGLHNHLQSSGERNTVTPKTVPMFGSFVLHMKWCV